MLLFEFVTAKGFITACVDEWSILQYRKESLTVLSIGFRPGRFWKWCWIVFTPLLCTSIAIFSLIEYEPVKYKNYQFPSWAEYIGWCIALSSILAIPIYAIAFFAKQTGSFKQRWKISTTPTSNQNPSPDDNDKETSQRMLNEHTTAMTNL
ncbi:unnamed protein product [Rotaria magnacalcarata]